MKLISVVTGSYNEEENVAELYDRICAAFTRELPDYAFEILFIDNASTDGTVAVLRRLAVADPRVKVIINNRNFGHIRSGYHAFLQARGDAVVIMASDLQDPPELIPAFVRKWEAGYKIVLAQKTASRESPLFYFVRRTYYNLIGRL
ncbi:MAG: glycosyltransferase family 2 protein, partial [Vicinamibacterales bacterium]